MSDRPRFLHASLLLFSLGLLAGCFEAAIEPGSLRCRIGREPPCPESWACLPEYAGAAFGRCYPREATNEAGTPPNLQAGLVWDAISGELALPFQATSGAIVQTVLTDDPGQGGRAAYKMNLEHGGSFVVQALVIAPSEDENSFFVNLDAEPSTLMIWDIPPDRALTWRAATWRGTGSYEDIPTTPQVFHLLAGPHTLVLRGREPNCRLARLCLLPYLPPPTGP